MINGVEGPDRKTLKFDPSAETVPMRIDYKSTSVHHHSMAHFWNEWYAEYFYADFPRLVVRFEDLVRIHGSFLYNGVFHKEVFLDMKTNLMVKWFCVAWKQVFHAKEVTEAVCKCAGGALNRHGFKYITESAKRGVGKCGSMVLYFAAYFVSHKFFLRFIFHPSQRLSRSTWCRKNWIT